MFRLLQFVQSAREIEDAKTPHPLDGYMSCVIFRVLLPLREMSRRPGSEQTILYLSLVEPRCGCVVTLSRSCAKVKSGSTRARCSSDWAQFCKHYWETLGCPPFGR